MVKIVLKRTIENFESLFKVTNVHINIKKDKKIRQCQKKNNIYNIKIFNYNNNDHISMKIC